VVWMNEAPLLPGRSYFLKIGTRTATATISPLKYKINMNTMQRLAAATLELNEIGVCNLELDRSIPFDPYTVNRDTGGFILIDRITNDTVGAGMLHFALRRASNVQWQALDVNKAGRSTMKGQKPCVLWFTGLSGAGKSTIANLVDRRLCELGRHSALLDGDNLRHGINQDLGFAPEARVENIRRVSEIAALFVDAGLITLVSLISPFRADRDAARRRFADGEFIEVHVATPLATCEARDPKGLYKRARAGELSNFTGIDQPYEAPDRPEIAIDGATLSASDAADLIVSYLREHHYF